MSHTAVLSTCTSIMYMLSGSDPSDHAMCVRSKQVGKKTLKWKVPSWVLIQERSLVYQLPRKQPLCTVLLELLAHCFSAVQQLVV